MTTKQFPTRTETAREKSGGEHNHNNQRNADCDDSALLGMAFEGSVPTLGRAVTGGSEKSYNIKSGKALAKAKAYWARKMISRKTPGNCTRCGKVNSSKTLHCPACLAYQAKWRESRRGKPVVVETGTLDALARRISSLEHELASMQLNARLIRIRAWNRAYKIGQRHERKQRERIELPVMSRQEAATLNHAYDADT